MKENQGIAAAIVYACASSICRIFLCRDLLTATTIEFARIFPTSLSAFGEGACPKPQRVSRHRPQAERTPARSSRKRE
jgi:hypothetical protein